MPPINVIAQTQVVQIGVAAGTTDDAVAVSQAETMHSLAAETRSSGLLHRQPTSAGSQPIADTALVMQVTY
jgi:hypothetical protein